MHPPEVKQAALDLIAAGHNDCEVSRRLRIPRRTIADWRRAGLDTGELCPRCWKKTKLIRPSAADYAELLALYLGDGCISAGPRTSRLRIALDAKYRQIIDEASALLSRVFRANRIGTLQRASESLVVLSVYSSHLPCLLPQHAPGKKHERPISLEEWQQAAVESAPWSFIRGCVHTDGCSSSTEPVRTST
jgi:hypothetical protein